MPPFIERKHILFLAAALVGSSAHSAPTPAKERSRENRVASARPAAAAAGSARGRRAPLPEPPAEPASASGLSLRQAFEAAVDRTESVKSAQESVVQADEARTQAIGAVLPKVALGASATWQDVPPSLGVRSAVIQGEATAAKIGLTQPLFRGFSEFAALRSTEASQRAAQRQKEAVRLNLFASVASAYFAVLAAEADVRNLRSNLELSSARVGELRERARIGRSRVSERLTAEAQVAAAQASLEAAEGALLQARDQFEFTTGLARESALAESGGDGDASVGPMQEYVSCIDGRPDVAAAKAQLEAAEEGVSIARGGRWPSIDLTGNYYFARTGVMQDSKWDVGLSLTFPLFMGGVIDSQVRTASSLVRQATLALSRARRAAVRDVETAHHAASSGARQAVAFRALVDAAERTYREQNKDYRFGLAQNIDVLTALNSLIDARRSYDRARYQAAAAKHALEAAAGRIQ